MRKRKLFGAIATFLMAAPLVAGLVGAPITANAAVSTTKPPTINFTLHKKEWLGVTPEERPNTGLEMNFDGKGLNGVDFTLYDVSNVYYNLLKDDPRTIDDDTDGLSSADALTAIQTDWNVAWVTDNYIKVGGPVTTAPVGGEDGVAQFTGIGTTDTQGRDRVLMFVETYSPADISVVATPMVVLLPVMMPNIVNNVWDGTWLDTYNTEVQLYPKNAKQEPSKSIISDEKKVITVEDDEGNVTTIPIIDLEKGVELDYRIIAPIPSHIRQTNAEDGSAVIRDFYVTDVPSDHLQYVLDSMVVTDVRSRKILIEDEDYTIIAEGYENGFRVVLNTNVKGVANEDLLKKLTPGGQLSLDYKMVLTSDAIPDQLEDNTANIVIGRDPDTNYDEDVFPPEKVVTGGRKFEKFDASTKEKLSGAKFILWDDDKSHYAVFLDEDGNLLENNEYSNDAFDIEWVPAPYAPEDDTKRQPTVFTSDANGEFEVQGLDYGNYVMQEIEAPTGYALPAGTLADTPFDVFYGSYDSQVTGVGTADSKEVPNTRKGTLPSTGGTGIIAFIVVGLGMMIGAYVWFKKSKRTAI